MLLFGRHEGHPARKNFSVKTLEMAVNVRLHLFANRPCVRKWVEYIPLCPVYNPTYLLQKEGMHSFTLSCKALSTLLQKSETVAEKCDCRRIQRQSHFSATV